MSVTFPTFRDRFLEGISRQFERRRKALAHRAGTLYVDSSTDAPDEELFIRYVSYAPSPTIILEAFSGNRLSLYLRSSWNKKRGKILVRLDNERGVHNPQRVIDTFEWTISESRRMDRIDSFDEKLAADIATKWRALLLRAVD